MKNLMNHVQNGNGNGNRKELVDQYSPNSGIELGQPGTIPRWGSNANGKSNFMDHNCFYCGGKNHHIPDCDELKNDLKTGYVKLSNDGEIRNNDGGYIPSAPNGTPIKERIEKLRMWKQNQFYCGYDESEYISEPVVPMYPAQFWIQQRALFIIMPD